MATKEYVCKRLRLYDWLSMRGWKPVRRIADMQNSEYINWVYEVTPEFNKDIKLYFKLLKERHKEEYK